MDGDDGAELEDQSQESLEHQEGIEMLRTQVSQLLCILFRETVQAVFHENGT